ncbi:DUF4282 domain-containing protein [Fontimonas sp. SYSU GA230001]|uniref:DUF4282 domain-containing protein n=1 Tax=Fontimonas sp. SYSU GA230001 TaxID=3142450 RepID=UPI0032B46BFD
MESQSEQRPVGVSPFGEIRRLVLGLADVQFSEMLTPRLLPTIYGLGIVFAALLTLYRIAMGFRESWGQGVAWLVIVGPATFLAVVGALRIGLEFMLAIFRVVVHVERLDEIAHRIHGQTEEIAEDLPRIQFWRAFSRLRRTDSSGARVVSAGPAVPPGRPDPADRRDC